jgi:PAP2 superfamily
MFNFTHTNKLRNAVALAVVFVGLYGCKIDDNSVAPDPVPISKDASSYDATAAIAWAEMDLKLIRQSAGFTPPVAARALGYAGLTMYEAVVPGIKARRSLVGQLTGLKSLPKIDSTKEYHWVASANAAQAFIAKNIWANMNDAAKKSVDSLETAIKTSLSKEASAEVLKRSEEFGVAIATAIFEWSKTDGGHEGYLRNFPATYKVSVFAGSWQPTENGRKIPMQPYWGQNRVFVNSNRSLTLPQPLLVSTEPSSIYFKAYDEVYQKNKTLSQAEKEIAVWWSDDPSETFTPPGHSYNLAKIAVQTSKAKFDKAVEAFGRTGITVSDAFVLCWNCKFVFMNERPYTFVRRAIDPYWVPFWPAPPFPGYTSGHATQSAATAVVLTNMFGENFAFTDNSHVGRVKDIKRNVEFKARSFKSFWESAEESALSRFLGGIHTRQDNNTGLAEGKKIAANTNALKWTK